MLVQGAMGLQRPLHIIAIPAALLYVLRNAASPVFFQAAFNGLHHGRLHHGLLAGFRHPAQPRETSTVTLSATTDSTRSGNSSTGKSKRLSKRIYSRKEQETRDATIAWLEERLQTEDAMSFGRRLFLASPDERQVQGSKTIESIKKILQQSAHNGDAGFDEAAADSVFLGAHALSTQTTAWLGADAWPTAILMHASVPGLSHKALEQVFMRDLAPGSVSGEEISEVVNAFVEATWGDQARRKTARQRGFEGVQISVPPQFACMQYCIGVLWGYALRGLVFRCALDRSMGTLPESLALARKRLERQFSLSEQDSIERAESGAREALGANVGGTLMRYACEFFGHDDWAALCRPTDATIQVMESELEEALPGMAMLSGVDDEEAEYLDILGLDEDDEIELDELVLLLQEDWEAFQRRAVALGGLLADAEALAETEVGQLPRGQRQAALWAQHLVRSGALTGMRREHGSMAAGRIAGPLLRLAAVLRRDFLPSKLRSAASGLNRLFDKVDPNNSGDGDALDPDTEGTEQQ